MAANSNADELPLEQIIAELRAVRLATQALFDGFNQQILDSCFTNWAAHSLWKPSAHTTICGRSFEFWAGYVQKGVITKP
jgi:hypothetical protein